MASASSTSLKETLTKFALTYKVCLISAVVLAVTAAFLNIAVDYKVKEIIDAVTANEHASLTFLLGLFVLYKFLFHGTYFFWRLLGIYYAPRINAHVLADIYNNAVQHSLHWFDSHLSGEISSKIADFQEGIETLIAHGFQLFNVVSIILIMILFLCLVNTLTALTFFVFILIYTPVIYCLLKKQIRLRSTTVNARQNTLGIVNDTVANIFSLKVVGNLAEEFKRMLKPSITQWQQADRKMRQFDAFYIDNMDTFMIVLMSAIQMYLLVYLYQKGVITAGGFAFVFILLVRLHHSLSQFVDLLLLSINPSIAKIKSSYNFINVPVDVVDAPNAISLASVEGRIDYKNVDFSYGSNNKPMLEGFNLSVKPGERLGIVGLSGAGKTTLIKCLLRYFDVKKGGIFLDGHDIKTVSQASLRQAISIIPQDIILFHRTILDNIKLAHHEATDEEVMQACRLANIHEAIVAMPQGYDTVVGERGVKLSGGQRQRLAIARAILKQGKVLILDEATSSLDTPTEQAIQSSINQLLNTTQSTVIAIAHRLSTLKNMDRIIVMEGGKIIEEGAHSGLIQKKDGAYKKLWDMQAI